MTVLAILGAILTVGPAAYAMCCDAMGLTFPASRPAATLMKKG